MLPDRPPEDPWTQFALAVFRINGLIMGAGEDITRPLGQTSARWQVLGRAFEPRTVAGIAADIGNARQSVQRVADVLADEGLIAYREHPTDRRTKLLELTPAGRAVLNDIYERQVAWSEQVLAALSPDQLFQASAALGVIAEAVEGLAEAAPDVGDPRPSDQPIPSRSRQ